MTKLEIMQLSQSLSNLYTGLETDLIANIAEYLADGNLDSPTAQWKIQMLARLGALDKANIKTIAEYAGIAPDMLTEALETAALNGISELEPGFQSLVRDGIVNGTEVPIEKTMAKAVTSYRRQALKSLNLVNTVMRYKAKSTAQKVINDTAELAEKQSFIDMLNKAAGKAVTGIESRQAAMRQCIKEMSEKGIPAFVDKLGREWSPEAYINMDIRTTVANTAQQAQFDRMDDYGLDLIEVSSHAGARPKCAEDQGKIFNRKNKDGYTTDLHGRKVRYYSWKRSSYGEPDGILGINCGHHIYPFIPGLSYQTYFPYDEYENQQEYKKIQNQRELERRVRKSKRECMAFETAGDTEGLQKAQVTLKNRQKALKQYCADNGLRYKPDRTAVVNYRKSVAGFTPTDKKSKIAEIKAKAVDKSGRSGIIREETNQAVYKKFSTGEEVNKFFYYDSDNHSILAKKKSQYSQWVKNLSDETKDVIDNYSTDGYDDINRYWRKIGGWESINKDKVLYQTEKLDNAIASFELKDNLKVYRGVDLGTIANMFPDAEELTDLRGKIYSDKAFSSTSPISDVAKRFVEQNGQDGIMLELDIPSGAGKGAYLDALSAFGESIVGSAQAEYEFLLKRGAKFEIYDIDETNSFPILKGRWLE